MLIFKKGDPNFDKLLINIGISNDQKIRVFLTICLIIRLLIAGVILQYYNNYFVPYIIFIFSILAVFNLYNNLNGKQWWNRYLHLLIAILLSIMSLYQIVTGKRSKILGILLYMDVFIGIMTFIYFI